MTVDYIKIDGEKAELMLSLLKKVPWEMSHDAIVILLQAEKVYKPEVLKPEVVSGPA